MHFKKGLFMIITLILSVAPVQAATIINTCQGLKVNQTRYCGSHGTISASVYKSATWQTNHTDHCRQICLTAASPSACGSFNYNATDRQCNFYSSSLAQNGYRPNQVQPNVTWYDRDCFPRPCYQYCSLAQMPQPVTLTGQPQLDPSFEFGDDYHAWSGTSAYDQSGWQGLAQPPTRKCEANAFPYDGIGFYRLDSKRTYPEDGPRSYFENCYAYYNASVYYRLVNLTLNNAIDNPSCTLFLGSDDGASRAVFDLRTTTPMPKYKLLKVSNVPVEFDAFDVLNLYVGCNQGSRAIVDIDRFVWTCQV